jgi:alkyldihydroxyacetonephosphate synthase
VIEVASVDLVAVRDALAGALGPACASDRALDRLAYGHDTWPVSLKAPGETRWQPDLVAWPGSADDVVAVVRIAAGAGLPIVPVGGLSGIVGGALAVRGGIALDLLRMNRVLELDEVSGLVRVEAGILGANLEDALAGRGLTTGHLPQSAGSSTVGGWIAHRAAGIASTKYGKIESIVRGMRVVLADGSVLDTSVAPASASGPMLHSLFFGVEGTLGVVVEATLAIQPLPDERRWVAYGFAVDTAAPNDPRAADAAFLRSVEVVRRVLRRGYRPAIVRAYDPAEAGPLLVRAGLDPATAPRGGALLIVGAEGEAPLVAAELAAVAREAADAGGVDLGPGPAEAWSARRFDTSWLVGAVRGSGSIGDALEVAASWRRLPGVYVAMRAAMREACGPEGAVVAHLSHAYPDGGNLYMIFRTEQGSDRAAIERYPAVVDAALGACLAAGGTVSHHHGIGLGKARWFEREVGPVGLSIIRRQKAALDPAGILNPGKLGDAV